MSDQRVDIDRSNIDSSEFEIVGVVKDVVGGLNG